MLSLSRALRASFVGAPSAGGAAARVPLWLAACLVAALAPLREAPAEPVAAAGAGAAAPAAPTFRDDLADGSPCPHCPLMAVIPAGDFVMGSPAGGRGNEIPAHPVAIAQPFALGVYEVTFDQWDACVAAGHCRPARDEGWGRGSRPAINLAWGDAAEYVAWLSSITGQPYRLPSEAEWEYAARAGTTTAYYWGDEKGSTNAVCESCGSPWDNLSTAPTGSFPPNPFGLYDMLGNAWEWAADCWNPSHAGAPADGSIREDGDCTGRVLRGGAWFNFPRNIRSAVRMRGVIDNRYLSKGLRVARAL